MVLLFIVVLSLGAALSMRRAILGEGVSAGQLDYEIARQAAEAALRDAEIDVFSIRDTRPPGAFCTYTDRSASGSAGSPLLNQGEGATCPLGRCAPIADQSSAAMLTSLPWGTSGLNGRWNDNPATKPQAADSNCNFTGGVPMGTFTGLGRLTGVTRQPEYLLERLSGGIGALVEGAVMFRITARGFGLNPTTEVVLQSFVVVPR
jgi:type IV pilus assembly protein PilX